MFDPVPHAWRSPNTGCDMRIRRFGGGGPLLLYAPSSGGDESEFQRYGLDRIVAPWLDAGRLQVMAIDGRGPHTFWDDTIPGRARIERYAAFERYLVDELLPWALKNTLNLRLSIAGPSYGAFVAANLLFKHPQFVEIACGLGGVYDLSHRLDGYHDDDVYFHTPLEYLPRLEDLAILDRIRGTSGLSLFASESDRWLGSTHRMQTVLREKLLPHEIAVWPAPADHHEHWWSRQFARFLESHF